MGSDISTMICGISGERFVKGDKYVVQHIEPEREGQIGYDRVVLTKNLGLGEEELAKLEASDQVLIA